ncbi:MAG: DNA-directed RNA polymerase subunit E'' [Candidatus Aenigmarchaeota archaeon]|nr:DNA-directed RNA polymerase subunit E'' [Candidatus Aenigmarchaeota archaeon]
MTDKACKQCKRIIEKGNRCEACHTSELTSSYQGSVIIFDVESEIAKRLHITAPGKYAIKV